MLQKVAFHIVVLANPDGYVFSMAGELENRMKRKNMADSGCSDPQLDRCRSKTAVRVTV